MKETSEGPAVSACVICAMLVAAFALAVGSGCGTSEKPTSQPQTSMKGYELYSWTDAGSDWDFALLVGTNRLKVTDEILAARVTGVDRIEAELAKLPKGEVVFWTTRGLPKLSMPPQEVIDQVKAFCRQRGIVLTVDSSQG
jgi:hypothetical protein